jgi:hypothetical protein
MPAAPESREGSRSAPATPHGVVGPRHRARNWRGALAWPPPSQTPAEESRMSSVPQNHDAAKYRTSPEEPVTYPEQQVLAVFDDEEALAAAIEELTRVGVPDSDLDVACGTERADALRASTGRSGLANLAIRIADQLGIKNTEMEAKARDEQARRPPHQATWSRRERNRSARPVRRRPRRGGWTTLPQRRGTACGDAVASSREARSRPLGPPRPRRRRSWRVHDGGGRTGTRLARRLEWYGRDVRQRRYSSTVRRRSGGDQRSIVASCAGA